MSYPYVLPTGSERDFQLAFRGRDVGRFGFRRGFRFADIGGFLRVGFASAGDCLFCILAIC